MQLDNIYLAWWPLPSLPARMLIRLFALLPSPPPHEVCLTPADLIREEALACCKRMIEWRGLPNLSLYVSHQKLP